MNDHPVRVEEALEMTGCRDMEDLIDMANVGRSLLESIGNLATQDGPFKNWTPAQDPAEIVFDLVNHYEDQAALTRPDPSLGGREALEELTIKWRGLAKGAQEFADGGGMNIGMAREFRDRASNYNSCARELEAALAAPSPPSLGMEGVREQLARAVEVLRQIGASKRGTTTLAHTQRYARETVREIRALASISTPSGEV